MHHNRLINLFASNSRRGEFRAEGNTIYLYDMIVSSKVEAEWFGGVDAETFVQTLKGMSGDVTIRVNSPGGDVFAARAMSAAIAEHAGKVSVYVDGYAASAASFITSAADETIMSAGSMLMIHKAWTIGYGNADDLMATAGLLEKIDGTIAATYAASAAKRGVDASAEGFADLMAAETWFTGQEAIDAGLADAVAAEGPKNSRQWDLSAYENAPDTFEENMAIEARRAAPRDADRERMTRQDLVAAFADMMADHEKAAQAAADQTEIERKRRVAALKLRQAA